MSFSNSSRSIILLECLSSNSRLNSPNLFSYAFFFRFSRLNSASVSSFSPLECWFSFVSTSTRREEKKSWCSSRLETISSCVEGMCPVKSSRLWRRVSPATKGHWNFSNTKAMTMLKDEAVARRAIVVNVLSFNLFFAVTLIIEEKQFVRAIRFRFENCARKVKYSSVKRAFRSNKATMLLNFWRYPLHVKNYYRYGHREFVMRVLKNICRSLCSRTLHYLCLIIMTIAFVMTTVGGTSTIE